MLEQYAGEDLRVGDLNADEAPSQEIMRAGTLPAKLKPPE
jgi:hypothetical protein